jgi:cyclophilin family peptidyl-prolyl cis-trans isomerase
MAELRRAQQRRRTQRRGAVIGGIIVIALILAAVTSGVFSGGSSKKKTTVSSSPGDTATLTATAQAALKPLPPPPTSTTCTAPASTDAPTTTIPAKGNAVATIQAPSSVPFPNLDGSSPHYTKFTAAPPWCLDLNMQYTATVKTDVGTVTILLLPQYAPLAVNNFVFLAGYHYFDGTVFHRVIPGFVDQGGDPTGTGTGGPGYSFADELPANSAAYDTGAVAMANSGPNTNGSQFFWVVAGGGAQLNPASYSMFGQITSGIDVMNKINADGTSGGTPKVLHRILSVTIQETAPPPAPAATTTTAAPATTATTAPATTAGASQATTTPTTSAPATTAAPAG